MRSGLDLPNLCLALSLLSSSLLSLHSSCFKISLLLSIAFAKRFFSLVPLIFLLSLPMPFRSSSKTPKTGWPVSPSQIHVTRRGRVLSISICFFLFLVFAEWENQPLWLLQESCLPSVVAGSLELLWSVDGKAVRSDGCWVAPLVHCAMEAEACLFAPMEQSNSVLQQNIIYVIRGQAVIFI